MLQLYGESPRVWRFNSLLRVFTDKVGIEVGWSPDWPTQSIKLSQPSEALKKFLEDPVKHSVKKVKSTSWSFPRQM